jgi:hypothetical protein
MMTQVLADVAAENLKQKQDQLTQEMESARLRQAQGQLLAREFSARVEEYEVLRKQLHGKLGEVWQSVQEYSRLTGVAPGTFPEQIFMGINTPSLVPSKDPWHMSASTTTVHAAVQGWFASMGRQWL